MAKHQQISADILAKLENIFLAGRFKADNPDSIPMTPTRAFLVLLVLAELLALGGCAAASTVGTIANIALEVTGIKKSDASLPDSQKPPRHVALKLHAGGNLNADANGRPLAVVTRIYKLKQNTAFQQAPYDLFLNPQKEKEVLGADLLEVKEVTLIPGQRYETTEKVSKEAEYIGVVTLFHSPAPHRWRLAFRADQAEKSGITLGVHGCALSVGFGTVVADSSGSTNLPAATRCH